MERKVTPLTWQKDIKNKARSESIDDEFILLDDFSMLPLFNYPFKQDMFLFVILTKGTAIGRNNLQFNEISSPSAILIYPEQIMQYEHISDDFAGYCVILSQRFAYELMSDIGERLSLTLSLLKNPYKKLNKKDLRACIRYYFTVKNVISMTDNPYRLQIIKHLTLAFFYQARPYIEDYTQTIKPTRQSMLIEKFINCVKDNFRKQRKTAFYADKLCLTPKYLSEAVKAATGKSASDWIDDYVTLEIKALLKSTNMTIQQISDELNFPSQSFFGKYFKRNTGMSPKEYRGK